jgi:NADH dehydrogenase FAD-containing subunit
MSETSTEDDVVWVSYYLSDADQLSANITSKEIEYDGASYIMANNNSLEYISSLEDNLREANDDFVYHYKGSLAYVGAGKGVAEIKGLFENEFILITKNKSTNGIYFLELKDQVVD